MSKINLVPYSCPRANQCREFLYYKIAVKKIKNNQQYFLNHIEELRKIAYNCPHQIEDGFWNGFLPSDEWLLYLKCDIFSDWFWNEAIQVVEVSDGLKRKTPPWIIPFSKLPEWQEQHKFSTNGLFSFICRYPTDDPYVGGVISPYYADFDCEENPDKARKEAVALIKKLKNDYDIPEGVIKTCFSGMKGVSLTIDHTVFKAEASADLPLIYKSISQELATKLKLKTIDLGIYERRRLWRLPNSKHQKTGLYKIPLDLSVLEKLNINEIKALAALPQCPFEEVETKTVPKAEKLFLEHKAKVENWASERKKTFEKSELTAFVDDPPCIKRLLETGATKGERNNSTFHVAIYYASKGLCL